MCAVRGAKRGGSGSFRFFFVVRDRFCHGGASFSGRRAGCFSESSGGTPDRQPPAGDRSRDSDPGAARPAPRGGRRLVPPGRPKSPSRNRFESPPGPFGRGRRVFLRSGRRAGSRKRPVSDDSRPRCVTRSGAAALTQSRDKDWMRHRFVLPRKRGRRSATGTGPRGPGRTKRQK